MSNVRQQIVLDRLVVHLLLLITHHTGVEARADDALDAVEGACTDEEDLLCIDLDKLLLGMLATTIRGDVDDAPLEELEKTLLNPFTTHITSDGGVVAFAGYLVDLIDEDDATLCSCDVIVAVLQ